MFRKVFIFIFCLIFNVSFSQSKRNYKVFQFMGKDSLNGHISKIVKFNELGKKIYEKLIDFKSSKVDGIVDYEAKYFYKDTLLIKEEHSYNELGTKKSETTFKYNVNNLLVFEEDKTFERRLKKNIKKGIEYGDCTLEKSDYEKNPTWEISAQIYYKYNSKNQLIEKTAPKYYWDNQNRYLYEYDQNGKLIREISLHNDEELYDEHFEHFDNCYDYFLKWHDDESLKNLKIVSRKDWPYFYKVCDYKDEKGNLIKHTETDKEGNIEFEIKNYYNSKNELIKEERYNEKGELEITHNYIYE